MQWGANEVANMVGQALNPATWVLGEAGGLAMKPLSYAVGKIAPTIVRRPLSEVFAEPFAKYFPEKIGKEGQTLSMGLFGDKLAQGFGIGAASMLPQATVDNFNAELNKHDILGIAKGMGMGGVFGMGISTIPFAWGILKANINRKRGISTSQMEPVLPGEPEKALEEGIINQDTYDYLKELEVYEASPEGKIEREKHLAAHDNTIPQEIIEAWRLEQAKNKSNADRALIEGSISLSDHKLFRDLESHLNNSDIRADNRADLSERATSFLSTQGHSVDQANHTAQFEILNKDQINNLQSASADRLLADSIPEEQRNALTDFSVNNGLDDVLSKPGLIDGVRGYIQYISKNLLNKNKILADADRLVDEHIDIGIPEGSIPLDQKSIFEISKEFGDTGQFPFYVPENIRNYIRKYNAEFIKYVETSSKRDKHIRMQTTDNFLEHEFYHGTGYELGNINDFDIRKSKESSLYGPGLYLTDNKYIALGYSHARGVKRANQPIKANIIELEFKKEPKLIDVEIKPEKDIFDTIKKLSKETTGFEIPDEFSTKTIDEILETVKRSIKVDRIRKYSEFLLDLNGALENKGYDGYLHTGGLRVQKKIQHNVIVLFGHRTKNKISNPAHKLKQKKVDIAHEYQEKKISFEKLSGEDTKKINELEAKKTELQKVKSETIHKKIWGIDKEISKLRNEKLNLPDAREEMNLIRDDLFPSKILDKNFRSKDSYKRLVDLAEILPPAKTLLDRVHLEAEILAQEAYRNQAKMVVDIADSNIGKLADIEKVKGYLEARTAPKINDKLEPTIKMEEVEKGHDVPTDAEIILAEQDRLIEGREKDMPVKEYITAKEKFNEFKGSEGIFKNMINCVLGNQK